MSQLSQIKSQISAIAAKTEQTAAALNAYAQELQNSIAIVNSSIGGTSSNDDKDMVSALQAGQKSVKDAAMQLANAATKAKEWVSKA